MSRRAPWVDWVAVERAVTGQPVGRSLTRHERHQALTRLIADGDLTSADIADRLGMAVGTVRYHRARAGDKAAGSRAHGGIANDVDTSARDTVLAARAQNRRSIGVEIEERYCELIARRLSQGDLFADLSGGAA